MVNQAISYLVNLLLPFLWGVICGRLRTLGLALLLLPHIFLIAYYRDEIFGLGQIMMFASIAVFYVAPSLLGYFIGYFWWKRKKTREKQEDRDRSKEKSERRPDLVRFLVSEKILQAAT